MCRAPERALPERFVCGVRCACGAQVGRIDPKRHLESAVEEVMTSNISQMLGSMVDAIVF